MKDLTDLEVCTRIAEIEGYEFLVNDSIINGNVDIRIFPTIHLHDSFIFNPLTDDALCFQLIIKYEVEVLPLVAGVNCKHSAVVRIFNGCDYFMEFKEQSDTLNRAICLAIIKAHE